MIRRHISHLRRARLLMIVFMTLAMGCTVHTSINGVSRTLSWKANDHLLAVKQRVLDQPEGEQRCAAAERAVEKANAQALLKTPSSSYKKRDSKDKAALLDLLLALWEHECHVTLTTLKSKAESLKTEASLEFAEVRRTQNTRIRIHERLIAEQASHPAPLRFEFPDLPPLGTTLHSIRAHIDAAVEGLKLIQAARTHEQTALVEDQAILHRTINQLRRKLHVCERKRERWQRVHDAQVELCTTAQASFNTALESAFIVLFDQAQQVRPGEFFKSWFAAARPASNEFEEREFRDEQKTFRHESLETLWVSKVRVPVPTYDFNRRAYHVHLPVIVDTITPYTSKLCRPGFACLPPDVYLDEITEFFPWYWLSGIGSFVTSHRLPRALGPIEKSHKKLSERKPLWVSIKDKNAARVVREKGGLILVTIWRPKAHHRTIIKYAYRSQAAIPYIQAKVVAQQLHHPDSLELLWSSAPTPKWTGPEICEPPRLTDRSIQNFLRSPDLSLGLRSRRPPPHPETFPANTTTIKLPEAPDCERFRDKIIKLDGDKP